MNGVVVVDGTEIAAFVHDMYQTRSTPKRQQVEQIVEDFLVWRFKKNGPASVGALPDRGSQSPKGKSNMKEDNTRPTDEAIVSAMRMLEGPIHSLVMMAELMGNVFDADLQDFDFETGERRPMPREGRNMTIVLTRGQIECLGFLWNDIIGRSAKLQKAYLAALDGKEIGA
ncbi:MAG: hypothetical protein ACTHOP_07575 [Mesorhizobium sp.]